MRTVVIGYARHSEMLALAAAAHGALAVIVDETAGGSGLPMLARSNIPDDVPTIMDAVKAVRFTASNSMEFNGPIDLPKIGKVDLKPRQHVPFYRNLPRYQRRKKRL